MSRGDRYMSWHSSTRPFTSFWLWYPIPESTIFSVYWYSTYAANWISSRIVWRVWINTYIRVSCWKTAWQNICKYSGLLFCMRKLPRRDPYKKKYALSALHRMYIHILVIQARCLISCFYRAIDIIEDTYNITLLALFVYFAILFAFYGFRIISVSIWNNVCYK